MAVNRRSFQTRNTLNIHGLVYITIMFFVLLGFFLLLANVGTVVEKSGLDSGEGNTEIVDQIVQNGSAGVKNEDEEGGFAGGNGTFFTSVYGDGKPKEALCSQLRIMGQGYCQIESLSEGLSSDLIVVCTDEISKEDIETLEGYVEAGGNVWFAVFPRGADSDQKMRNLLGIESVGATESYAGLRISSELLTGEIIEDTERETEAPYLKLKTRTKVYGCGLPENYEDYENEDLPPLVWRYIADSTSGSVYGNASILADSEIIYLMLPRIYSELQGSYLYGIVNAYCVLADGFPYADNAEAENWTRLYSRDKLSIEQDLLLEQYLKYAVSYGVKITYFTRDFETFQTADDTRLKYFSERIRASMGTLAVKTDSGLKLQSETDEVEIENWTPDFAFADRKNSMLRLPVNMTYTTDNREMDAFSFAGSVLGTGFYAVSIDVDEFLAYDGDDIWSKYCEEQEMLLGTQERDAGWLDCLTVPQAFARLYELLSSDTLIEYGEDSVCVKTNAEQAWFLLRTGTDRKASSEEASVEEIGEGCFLICVSCGESVIRLFRE